MKKLWFSILLFIIITMGSVIYFLTPISNYYLQAELDGIKLKYPGLEVDSFHLKPLKQQLTVYGINYSDTSISINLSIEQLDIKHISYLELIQKKILKADSLILDQTNLAYLGKRSESDQNMDFSDTKQQKLKSAYFESVTINAKRVLYLKGDSDSSDNSELSNLKLTIDELSTDLKQEFSFKDFNAFADSLRIRSIENYFISSNSLRLNQSNLSLLNTKIKSINNTNYQTTQINTFIQHLGINYNKDSLANFSKLSLNKVAINGFSFKSFMDKRKKPRNEPKPLIIEAISSIQHPFSIDTLKFKDGHVEYLEQVEDSPKPGKVYFDHVSALLTNISNDSSRTSKQKTLNIEVKGKLMGKAWLNSTISLNYLSPTQQQHISGSLDEMNLDALNPAFLPLAFVEFRQGKLNKLDFDFDLNKWESSGMVKFYYQDLKVIIHDRKYFERPKFLSKLETLLANTFLIRSDNPKKGDFKTGKINFQRDSSKSVFNFWWKSVFSGMTNTILNTSQ